jgi:transposase
MHIKCDPVGRRRRREHSAQFKSELVQASLRPGASVSAIALEHGLNANLLFAWRRMHLREQARQAQTAEGDRQPVLLPVEIRTEDADSDTAVAVVTSIPTPASPSRPVKPGRAASGTIEIDIGGAQVRVCGLVEEASLRLVLKILRGAVSA